MPDNSAQPNQESYLRKAADGEYLEPPEAPDAGVKAAGYMIIAVTLAVAGLVAWGLWV